MTQTLASRHGLLFRFQQARYQRGSQERQNDLKLYQIENTHSLALLAKLFARYELRQCQKLALREQDCWTLGSKTALCCVADTVQ